MGITKKGVYLIILLFLISSIYIIVTINNTSPINYIQKNQENFVGQEISYELINSRDIIQIYRSTEGIHVGLLTKHSIFGWKMAEISVLYFEDGPNWHYIEIENKDNFVYLVYGFFYDDIENIKAIHLKNDIDNIDIIPSSNLMFKTEARGWYTLLDNPSNNSDSFILYNVQNNDAIYPAN